MGVKFTKMHGLGNDFMVIDAINQRIDFTSADIAALSERNTGVGFDQCLLIETSPFANVDFFYRIFNANGQEVGQCGNGARCLARFAQRYGLTKKELMTVATQTTRMQLQINPNQTVTINMGQPVLQPAQIPLDALDQAPVYNIPIAHQKIQAVHSLSIGNPHAVIQVPDIVHAHVQEIGQQISEHHLFPAQTNVGFMQILTPQHIQLRVYERGCGETRACGSGAVAAVAVGRLYHQLTEK
ncbi:MAG TPA: diaminopimelate epimerase, partial [Legionella sp.]|nr:diaminopimelate epimerase [Legionella sp.]